ncbi:MAG: WGR domain-containing protein [Acetobacteraceae bacterium]|nr:WGR domain-containing protein [Acetobacteraceae bacterium]
MPAITLVRTDPARNMRRFYCLDVQPDLFGAWCLMREWGRIGRSGQLHSLPCASEAEARAVLERQRRRKERRGYCRQHVGQG